MEKTFTIGVDQAKEWAASLAKQALKTPFLLPPWLLVATGFVSKLDGKKLEITVRVVDE